MGTVRSPGASERAKAAEWNCPPPWLDFARFKRRKPGSQPFSGTGWRGVPECRCWLRTVKTLRLQPHQGNPTQAETVSSMQRFRATTALVNAEPGRLEGDYCTGRGQETHGAIRLRR